MQNDKYTDFDLELKRMLQDAEEEVPSRVWDAVSGELDRRDRRKVVALRWRRAAAGVAAAAAVLSGIFILGGRGDQPEPVRTAEAVQEVKEVVREAEAPQTEALPDIEEQIASSAGALADVPATPVRSYSPDVTVPSAVAPAETFVPEETPVEAPAEVPVVAEEEAVAETIPVVDEVQAKPEEVKTEPVTAPVKEKQAPVTTFNPADPFAWTYDDETPARENRTSLFLSGNAMTNDFTGTGVRQMRAPASGSMTRTGIEEKGTSSYAIPLTVGLGVRYNLSDRWALGTGLNWSFLSSTFNGVYTEVMGGDAVVRSINSEIDHEIHYIGIPLNVYYNILNSRNLRFYLWGGGEAERGIVNRYRIKADGGDIFYKEDINGLQFSAAAGLGLEFLLGDHLGLYLDPSARYYFDCGQPSSIRTKRPFMLNYEVGLRFNF
jgi:hypothetical protein